MVKKAPLAIILPAYKGRFLSETLDSVAAQTCRDFVLYIGDDASPDALQEIVRPYESRLPLVYHRFDRNLGRTDLAGHWERCIALSDEPLVWLFSDDDLMPPDGVARVLEAARTRGMKRGLFRFPLEVIHGDGTVKFHAAPLPSRPVRGYDLLLDKLGGRVHSAAVEYVFSRDVWQDAGGFVHFPMAWCADDATWAAFADQAGDLVSLPGLPVRWRNAEEANISNSTAYDAEKLRATCLFLQWIGQRYAAHRGERELRRAVRRYLTIILRHSVRGNFSLAQLCHVARAAGELDSLAGLSILYHHLFKIKKLV